jgi:hypothetical protein
MVRTVLGGNRSIESAWRNAPSANRHTFGFESTRSPGYVAQMDPERSESGFTRSIVLKAGLASVDVRRGARGTNAVVTDPLVTLPVIPSLVSAGVTLSMPTTNGAATVAGRIRYKIPFAVEDRANLPESVQASVRWDPIDVVAPDPAAETAPGTTPETPLDATAPSAPDFGLITAERVGDVVAPSALKITKTRMAFDVAAPAAPGRYRLTVMLHDAEGVAYDAATQAMVPALLVRVTGDLDAGIDAPTRLDLAPGAAGKVPVWVANLGKAPWGHKAVKGGDINEPDGADPATAALLTGTWIALGAADDPARQAAADAASVTAFKLPAGFKSRGVMLTDLALFAPSLAGDYLLVLDIVTPEAGSLTAKGVEPTIIRVTVGPQPVSTPAPAVNGE